MSSSLGLELWLGLGLGLIFYVSFALFLPSLLIHYTFAT